MAEFKIGEENNYGTTNTSSFFSIKEDGEVKKVRFMYRNADDIKGYAVHEVQVNGKRRYVNCLRNYNSPIDDCPLCKSGSVQQVKLYIPIYDVNANKVCFWERGKKFFSRMSSICSRFPDIIAHEFEIERHGAKGATDTTYEIFEVGHDNTKLEDLPEVPDVLGGIILDKSAQEMETYLRTGEFGYMSTATATSTSTSMNSPIPQRRTPVNSETEVF